CSCTVANVERSRRSGRPTTGRQRRDEGPIVGRRQRSTPDRLGARLGHGRSRLRHIWGRLAAFDQSGRKRPMQVIRRGDRGDAVVEIRAILTTLGLLQDPEPPQADAVYDAAVERAVRAFQQARGLTVNGEVNDETWRAIDAARWTLGSRVLAHEQPEPLFGDDVRQLQERLLELGYDLGRADGILGRRTATALASFQREVGLVPDGVCGPQTFAALRRLGRKVVGGRPNLLRETERFRAAGAALVDQRIVIDPGHGGGDPGFSVPDGRLRWTEADIAYDLAARLEGRLAATGMGVHLTRGPAPSEPMSESDRASLANELGADLLISIHLDAH